ncbi:MAG: amidase family protein, partial [Trebonia sp.]
MSELIKKTAAELASAVLAGKASAVEVTQAHLDRITAVDGAVKAFLHVNADNALAQAREVDRKRAAGEPLGALAGVPVAVKDLFTTIGMPTTCGSKILDGWVPPYESTVTRRLRDAGAVLIGKTNMDEF